MLCVCCANGADGSSEVLTKAPAEDLGSSTEERVPMPGEFDESQLRQTTEFSVSLEKPKADTVLGLSFDALDRCMLRVTGIGDEPDSPMTAYNASAPCALQLSVGDYIVEVNGVRGDTGRLVRELRRSTTLNMTVRRPMEFVVTIERSGALMGLFLHYSVAANYLVIQEVSAGPVKDWNDLRDEEKRVRKSDRIVSVNGVAGDVVRMLRALSQAAGPQDGVMNLLVSRPHESAAAG